jgi:hypothetical protein
VLRIRERAMATVQNPTGCIIKFFDKNLSEWLSKIGNNSEQHAIRDEVF